MKYHIEKNTVQETLVIESVIKGEYTPNSKLDTIILRDEAAANPKTKKETANRILLCYKFFRTQLSAMSIDSITYSGKLLDNRRKSTWL